MCLTARLCALVSVVAVVQDQKANRALTGLDLAHNNVADVGATALAEALKAPVCRFISSCSQTRAFDDHRCHFTKWHEKLESSSSCAVCVYGFMCFSFVLKETRCVAWGFARMLLAS